MSRLSKSFLSSKKRLRDFLKNPVSLHRRFPWLYWRIYEFNWSPFILLFENKISRSAPLVSIVGYLIYLNDLLIEHMGFDIITGNQGSIIGLSFRDKLVSIYFGLLLIAIGRLIYLWRRPNVIEYGPSLGEWSNYGLKHFTSVDFLRFHHDIRTNGNRTTYGKYYDDDWEAFWEDMTWSMSGIMHPPGSGPGRKSLSEVKKDSRKNVDSTAAKLRHNDLIRSILIDRYYEYAASKKISLLFAIIFSVTGFLFFLLPNLDLFLTILISVLSVTNDG